MLILKADHIDTTQTDTRLGYTVLHNHADRYYFHYDENIKFIVKGRQSRQNIELYKHDLQKKYVYVGENDDDGCTTENAYSFYCYYNPHWIGYAIVCDNFR